MTISSRTPEGESNDCPLCGHHIVVDPSRPPGDAPCPHCGTLMWFEPARQRFRLEGPHQAKPLPVEALPVGAGVIAFKEDANSGATQGHLGRVVRLLPSSVYENEHRPGRWSYRVHLPALGGMHDLAASSLIPTEGDDLPLILGDCLQFDVVPRADANAVFGAYLLTGGDWAYFVFRKSKTRSAFYRIAYSLDKKELPRCLWYEVPRRETLDRDYVQRAVEEVLGT